MKSPLDERLEALSAMSNTELRAQWRQAYGAPAPRISPELLRLGIAWRLQEKMFGGLGRDARLVIKSSGRQTGDGASPQRKLTPGTRLIRDWHGTGHVVTVLDSGFDYDDRHWTSLTAIARHITGAKWSGPRFFGLTGSGS